MSKEKVKLSDSEWKILSELWRSEPMTIMQLTNVLKEETGWTKSTVITLLKRMEEKEAVTYSYSDGAKHYRSIIKREDVAVGETENFLKRMYNGSIGLMVNSLLNGKALSKEDINDLYRILDSADKEVKDDA